MRFLIAISILQAILLAIVAFRVNDMDTRTGAIEAAIRTNSAALLPAANPTEMPSVAGPSAVQIREIIREELAANDQNGLVTKNEASVPSSTNVIDTRGAEEVTQLTLEIQQDLNFYKGQGRIDDAQMAQLQLKIAKLPPEERREALTKLTKLLNSGNVEARL